MRALAPRFVAALAAAVAAALPMPAGAAIFGSDDRVPAPPAYLTLAASIGLLSNDRSRTVCTAFCVADRVIATAGHCVFRTGTETAPPVGAFRFSRPAARGLPSARIEGAGSAQAAMSVATGSARLSVKPPINAPADWALIKLDAPVCAGLVLPVRTLTPDQVARTAQDRALFMVGFHRDFADWALAYSQPCEAARNGIDNDWGALLRDFVRPEQLILHRCDTASASSGAPLLVDGPNGPEVIGINVGTYVQSQVETQNGDVIRRFRADTVANTGVAAQAFAPSLAAFRTAAVAADVPTLRALQRALTAQGYAAGEADGRLGPALRNAIIAFEQASRMPVTGVPTRGLLLNLLGGAPAAAPAAARPTPEAPAQQAGRGRITPGRS